MIIFIIFADVAICCILIKSCIPCLSMGVFEKFVLVYLLFLQRIHLDVHLYIHFNPVTLHRRRSAVLTASGRPTRWWSTALWHATRWRSASRRWQRRRWCWLTWWCGPAWATRGAPCPRRRWTTSSSLALRSSSRRRRLKVRDAESSLFLPFLLLLLCFLAFFSLFFPCLFGQLCLFKARIVLVRVCLLFLNGSSYRKSSCSLCTWNVNLLFEYFELIFTCCRGSHCVWRQGGSQAPGQNTGGTGGEGDGHERIPRVLQGSLLPDQGRRWRGGLCDKKDWQEFVMCELCSRMKQTGRLLPHVICLHWLMSFYISVSVRMSVYQWLKNWHSSGYPVRRLTL